MIDILRSEWTKIRSVRSTVWTLAIAVLLLLGMSALLNGTADDPVDGAQAISLSLGGVMLASLPMAALGVLVISSEYRTGAIRVSLMAVPRRLSLLTGKVVVFAVTSMVVCTLALACTLAIGLAISRPATFDAGAAVQVALGSALYLTACGLFGLGLGTLIRHTPGAVVSVIALILVVPPVTNQLPGQWGDVVAAHFTTNAGMLVVTGHGNEHLGAWSGFGVYMAWIAVALVAGAVLLRRRDA
ncbi:ABC transporter permease [Nonomuraea longispora]|uniref:ABC transporter permease n=1 Tax=Nonomuraea longispora TaxID=1848320 RepID=A0A4R4NPX5_9ACTN|nr:ABC transporter permease subunit [Nonomuraea longispora]TDC10914.1 ABC transporter permease [Nonomuraea longispora]